MVRRLFSRYNCIPVFIVLFFCMVVLSPAAAVVNAQEKVSPSDSSAAKPQTPAPKATSTSDESPSHPKLVSVAEKPDLLVEFVEDAPGVIIIKSGNKTYRVDSASKTISEIREGGTDMSQLATNENDAKYLDNQEAPEMQDDPEEEDEYFYEPGDEPFDYRLVNVPTAKRVPKGTWNISFSHRFSQPIHPISESAESLLGFDSFSVSAFSVAYGITDKVFVSAGRSPVCRRGLCKTIEIGAGYHFTDQNDKSPLGLLVFGSVEGDMNFSKDYTGNLQLRMSRRIGNRVHLFFSPAVHLYSNGGRRFDPKPEDFNPPAPIANTFNQPKHGASFGFGTAVMITPTLLGVFEFTPRTGFKLGRVTPTFDQQFNITGFQNTSEPSIGFGVQKNIGNHSFSLTFSNTQTTTTSRYNSSNLQFSPKKLTIGFNLFRRL